MTDYRLRNHDLLYATRGKRPLDWKAIAIFGLIAALVTIGVAGQLAERFNAATSDSAVSRQRGPAPAIQVATPGAARSDF
jgi:hypothetical protein